ncbi:MAG: HEAT repeat domain-containing protein [Ktedonobacteraceae bacterium]|nr:HEAT repeat domain-containing protein [Ktedonobacteraceae bacterium]
MSHCQRAQMLESGIQQSLNCCSSLAALPAPKARTFELPGDRLQYAPDRPADIQHLKLVITLDFEQETISGTAYTTFSTLYEEIRTIAFDAVELHIEEVALENGPRLAYTTTDQQLIVTLDRPYHYGEVFTIGVRYHAKPRTGLHFVKPAPEDPARPVQAFTFGQPRYSRYWYPCHDAPNDRATTEIIATVPAQFITISNGNLLGITDNGATRTHHWRHDVPHAAYLVSLVVGDFAVIEDSYNGKPVRYYIRKDRKEDAPLYLGKTPQMMRFFSEYTGVEYPYDNYDQTIVELYTGAMEHTSATTHSFMLVPDKRASLDIDLVPVVAHELAHQWFGDLVTCRDWPNGWLNEGFATYFEELWNEHDRGSDEFKWFMLQEKNGYLDEDRQYRRPIVYNVYYQDGFELFDRHLYNKGAWVLHMLRHQLGEANFRRGIKSYLQRNRQREVITADLERTLEEVTGRSLAQFFQQWVYSGGHPELEVSHSWDGEHKLLKLKIKQAQKVDDLTPCFVTPVDLAFTLPASDEAARDEQTMRTITIPARIVIGEDGQIEQSFFFSLEREPLMIRVDPDGWLLKTLKFERSTKMLRYQLAYDPDVLGRIEAAETLGEKKDTESIEALITALRSDAFWGVRAAAAEALGNIGNQQAHLALIQALRELDPQQFSRARAAVAQALGNFQAPAQRELARRSADALRAVLEKGDISYQVEAAAAEALGKTRTEGVVDFLTGLLERPSWMDFVQSGIFRGLGATGEDRIVDIIAGYLDNNRYHPTLRRGAVLGLRSAGNERHLYSEQARQRAVTALSEIVAHDTWEPVRAAAARALMALGERRPADLLERLASEELESGVQRVMRLAAHTLRQSDKSEEQIKQLRKDLDEVREENRKLREQLNALEARVK